MYCHCPGCKKSWNAKQINAWHRPNLAPICPECGEFCIKTEKDQAEVKLVPATLDDLMSSYERGYSK